MNALESESTLLSFILDTMNTKSALLTLFSILGFRLAMENERGFKRLPKYIRPINYELTFRPDLEKHTFEGHAKIKFTIDHNEPLKAFELYSSDLDIRNVLLDQMNVAYSAEPKEERIKIEPKRELSSGNYTLDIEFSGLLNDKMHGFYRSTYQREGKQYTLASTQFEPAYARKAFPCWDEPSFKATFDVTIEAPKDLTPMLIYSNGNGENRMFFQINFEIIIDFVISVHLQKVVVEKRNRSSFFGHL